VLSLGGWDGDKLNEDEYEICKELYRLLVGPDKTDDGFDLLVSDSKQRLDVYVRRFMFIHLCELYLVETANKLTKSKEDRNFFYFPVLDGCSVTNNIYLRFPDLSPLFPSRQIEKAGMFYEYVRVS
jgi:hypothetical protein